MSLFNGIKFECCEVSPREREEITQLVEANGGTVGMVNFPLIFMPRARYTAGMHQREQVYDIEFIRTCVEKGKIVNLQDFRLGPKKPLERFIMCYFLTRRRKYRRFIEMFLKYIEDSDSSLSEDESPKSTKTRRISRPSTTCQRNFEAAQLDRFDDTVQNVAAAETSNDELLMMLCSPDVKTKDDDEPEEPKENIVDYDPRVELTRVSPANQSPPVANTPKKTRWIVPNDDWKKNDKVASRLHRAFEYVDQDDGKVALLRTCATSNEGEIRSPKTRTVNDNGKIVSPKTSAANGNGKIVSPKTSAANDNGKIVSPKTNAANDNGKVVSPKTNAANDNGNIVSPKTNAVNNNGKIVSPTTRAVKYNGKIVSPTTSAANDNGKVVSPMTSAANDNEKVVSPISSASNDNEKVVSPISSASNDNEKIALQKSPVANGDHCTKSRNSHLRKNPLFRFGTFRKSRGKLSFMSGANGDGWTTDSSAIAIDATTSRGEKRLSGIIDCSSEGEGDDDDNRTVLEFARIPSTEEPCAPETASRDPNEPTPKVLSPIPYEEGNHPGPSGVSTHRRRRKIISSEDDENERREGDLGLRRNAKKMPRVSESSVTESSNESDERDKKNLYHKQWRDGLEKSIERVPPELRYMKFTQSERVLMVKYLCEHAHFWQIQPKGLKIWNSMLQSGLLAHRTSKSLQNHFVNSILPSIRDYSDIVSEKQMEHFLEIQKSTRT